MLEQILAIFKRDDGRQIPSFDYQLLEFLRDDGPLKDEIFKSREIMSCLIRDVIKPERLEWHRRRVEDEVHNLFQLLPVVESMRILYKPTEVNPGSDRAFISDKKLGLYKPTEVKPASDSPFISDSIQPAQTSY